jgi:hypothetical protein
MSIKTKIMSLMATHPTLVTFGIGLAITLSIGMALNMVDPQHAFAFRCDPTAGNHYCGMRGN